MSMEYRLRRTLPSDRVAIIMPVDHGLIFDRIEGLETPSAPFAAWANNDVTGFMMTPGQVKQTEKFFAAHPHLTRVLTIDTYYDYRVLEGGSHGLITTVEEAVRMGVDAVKMLFPWNMNNRERVEMCTRVGKVVSACDHWDIPLVLEPVIIGAPRTEEVIAEEEKVARIAYDLGAHIIKIAFPGEERTKRLVDELKVPLVIAGGPLAGDPADTVDAVAQTIRSGARGVIVGRNIWQRERKKGEETIAQIAKLTRAVKFND
ncbi:class I fructose-bisphosphate aldolase [Rhizobium ruizarguesonis]|jgi:class I fructose-bisphosphate aldolase|uniref:Deoxyribose-phosphate aldolase n=1 Tax=Rhizobium ruizarguesonis TaxID=2081791 RepID=A0AB38I8R4_9HYPH|nr:deoxyribose-phosphate aldolase [Rhizobium ruizarguesonis]MBY5804319.1 deoxyribose-phosphate aldolase [Rhizobium leguminosarum]NKL12983.1 deoxyribose-phosphate aldolase [Rhizobium leguminosarum bv. viciae]MBY5844874.1 deoxyribose-phosphate aldolase [Rhizobium leguminosarum]NEH86529.1 deoxyribose-phosphate aldolase [Rhizobium ruizarguesonis]NEI04649.1 deoxyribose-phosphate aldolase [Rhizobium ruizarguesonis]